jgi:hypothetical protein
VSFSSILPITVFPLKSEGKLNRIFHKKKKKKKQATKVAYIKCQYQEQYAITIVLMQTHKIFSPKWQCNIQVTNAYICVANHPYLCMGQLCTENNERLSF